MAEVIEMTEFDLAECLGLSDRRIRQLAQDGIVVKSRRGRYDVKQSVRGYIEFMKQQEKSKGDNLEKLKISREAEGLMHDRLRKRKTELQVQEMEKKLHKSEDVEFFWNAMIITAKSRITAIPVKCSPLLVGIEDRKEIQAILKREIADVLNELAEYDVDKFDADLEEDEADARENT